MQLKSDCEDAETLALADFILHLLWKHCVLYQRIL
jgi:hypothetical protein